MGNRNHSQTFLFERNAARLTCTNSESNFIARPSGDFRCDQRRFELFKLTLKLLTRLSASQKKCASAIGVSFRIRAINPNAKARWRLESVAFECTRIADDMQHALFDRKYPQVENVIESGAS